jgi:hypothetical protein
MCARGAVVCSVACAARDNGRNCDSDRKMQKVHLGDSCEVDTAEVDSMGINTIHQTPELLR